MNAIEWIAKPGVHRTGKPSTIPLKALGAALGGLVGGMAAGAILGLTAQLTPTETRAVIAIAAALCIVSGTIVRTNRPWQFERETSQALLGRGPLMWSFANGALLGFGGTSRLGFWTWYLIPLATWIAGSPIIGAVIWGAYGVTRMGVSGAIALTFTEGTQGVGVLNLALLARWPSNARIMTRGASFMSMVLLVAVGF